MIEKIKNFLSEHTLSIPGFLFSSILVIIFLATGFYWARKGMTLHTYIASFVAWTAYLLAHYFSVGKFMDGEPEKDSYDTPHDKNRAFLGGLVVVLGIVIGAWGLNMLNLPLTLLGSLLFISGYIVSHFYATGALL